MLIGLPCASWISPQLGSAVGCLVHLETCSSQAFPRAPDCLSGCCCLPQNCVAVDDHFDQNAPNAERLAELAKWAGWSSRKSVGIWRETQEGAKRALPK